MRTALGVDVPLLVAVLTGAGDGPPALLPGGLRIIDPPRTAHDWHR